MDLPQDFELLESLSVELDPLKDGFVGVLIEVYRQGTVTSCWRRPLLPATASSRSPLGTRGSSTPPSLRS